MGRPQRAQARNQRKQKEIARQESSGGAKKNGKSVEEKEKENRNENSTKEDGSSEDLGADFWDVDVIPASKSKEEEEDGFDLTSWTNMVEEKFKQSEETTTDSFSQQHCKSSHLKNLFVPQVRKMVQRSGPSQTCSSCSGDNNGPKQKFGKKVKKGGKKPQKVTKLAKSSRKGETSDPDKLWVCLSCANVGCSRVASGHALNHFESNPKHYLAVCLGTLQLWCYACDDQVKLERLPSGPNFKTVKECILEIAKISPANVDIKGLMKAKGVASKDNEDEDEDEVDDEVIDKDAVVVSKGQQPGTGLKGLRNLGNTCFYNSVMQNITHTALLREHFFGSGFPSLALDQPTLGNEGKLTRALKNFLANMWYTSGSTFSPNVLFSTICGIAPRFRGYHQQDAHELFFTLIDGIKQEEMKRRREAEKEKTGSRVKPRDFETFVDYIYGGKLVSVVTCHTCKNVSSTYEPFFDLSLPIANSDEVSLALKASLQRSKSRRNCSPSISTSSTSPSSSEYEYVQLSKRQRKKLQQHQSQQSNGKERISPPESTTELETSKEPTSTEEVITPKEAAVPTTTEVPPQVEDVNTSREMTPTTGETPSASEPESTATVATPEAVLSSNPIPASNTVSSVSDPTFATTSLAPVANKRSDVSVEAFFPDYRKHSSGNDNALGKRSGKATLLSCLDCFTMPEILDEDNRYGCEVCTRNKGGGLKEETHSKMNDKSRDTGEAEEEEEDDGDDHETGENQDKVKKRLVKTVASKQLLLCQLPKVLVVCLKRFKQTSRGTLSKNSEDVRFPADLDLSPYTFERPQVPGQGPEVGERQGQEQEQEQRQARQSTRYRLNGIVEHSGGIHGGHYVAFIRTGKDWNYYSDSMGRKANEGEVLETEAYMLFYQQIPNRPASPPGSHSTSSSSSSSSPSASSISSSVVATSEPVESSLPLISDVASEVINLPPSTSSDSSALTEDLHS